MQSLPELTQTDDPAIAELREWVDAEPTANRLLAPDAALAEQTLLQLQVTRQAMLGAQVFDTGGISAFGGRVRLRGSPGLADAPSLLQCNLAGGGMASFGGFILVGDDVLGGLFAINGGHFGEAGLGNVFWLPPDDLVWSDLEVGHSAFVSWCLSGDFEAIYASVQAPAARQVLNGTLPAWHEAVHCHPPLWTVEGQSGDVSTRLVPALELVGMHAKLSQVALDS